MAETAEAASAVMTTNRNCSIEITNLSSNFCLVNPKVFMESGFSFNPPQPTVRTTKTEVCSFTKDDNTATGAVGVLTYELFHMHSRHCNELVAVMFSVPFDTRFYKNWLGVGLFEHTRATDEALYKHMYYEKDFTNFQRHEAKGQGVTYHGRALDVMATMSDNGKAILKVEVYDKMA
ncbi:DELTA-sagatoxin-Srs1a-like [Engraulis encrasicolus]|uniref:DELTA-sagatoxin-Srs1a-like n=1 Tax=Engraulis encrasicolus TaxID=184585 RepID=UPI002FD66FFE